MKTLLRVLSVAFVALAVSAPAQAQEKKAAAPETKAVKTMAGILASLNHFPNDADKKALQGVIDDKATTADEKVVAQAMLNIQHTAAAADKPKLQALIDEKKTSEGVR